MEAPSVSSLPTTRLTAPGLRPPAPPLPPGLSLPHEAGNMSSLLDELGLPGGASSSSAPKVAEDEPNLPDVGRDGKFSFPPHLDDEAVKDGLAKGVESPYHLIRGTLRVSSSKLGIAFVKPDGAKRDAQDLVVRGKIHRNRAVHGDVVIVQTVLYGRQEEQPEDEDSDEEDAPGLAANSDSDEEVVFSGALMDTGEANGKASSSRTGKQGDASQSQPQMAKVVAIADPKGQSRVIVCTLHPFNEVEPNSKKDGMVRRDDTFIKAKPTDKRLPWFLIQINDVTRKVLRLPGKLDKFQLWPGQIIAWKETSPMPLGRLKGQCLGKAGTLEAEERHALIENELDTHDVDFVDEQLDEVDQVVLDATKNFQNEVKRRHDLQSWRIFTIDPATAKDLDDAIHVKDLPQKGQIEVGVHIADVGHFLKLGTITDTEAQRRSTSVYLINRVLPMLPHGLCNHLCSLNPNEPKLAFSVFYRLDKRTGELITNPRPWFEKTAIRSCCRLNYDEVQDVLDGNQIEEPVVHGQYTWQEIQDDIFLLYDVCGKVRSGRLNGGAITISKAKMIFHTRESEDGVPTGYHLESHSASHWIIEELMLLANRCVAEHLANSCLSDFSVLRNHKAPDGKKAGALEHTLRKNLGLTEWSMKSSGAIYQSLQAIRRRYGPMLGACIEMMTMRAGMKQAEYFAYGEEGESPHHFALNFDYYTHFTSPIRRYPDVMVHRVLCALLDGQIQPSEGREDEETKDRYFQTRDEALDQVKICNEKKTASRRCQEQLDRAVFCIYLRSMKEWCYTIGTILAFHRSGNETGNDAVTVYCSQLGKESKARLHTASDDDPASRLELFVAGVNDELLLPAAWRFRGRGCLELDWSQGGGKRLQVLKTLSSVPIVIIPTNTVPIDYAVFFVSPFHPRFGDVSRGCSEQEISGLNWQEEDEQESDRVDVMYSEDTITV